MSSVPTQNEQWIYAERPEGRVSEQHYRLQSTPLDTRLARNEVLIQARHFSVDPYMRIQQAVRDTYDVPHPLGVVQRGAVVGEVIASASESFRTGDWVSAYSGWQRFAICHAGELQKLDPAAAPVTTVLGMPGRTAWFGLMEAGRPRPGDTLVVSGAAGAVGSLVAQFGKKAGCRVIGIAGGAEKCAHLLDKLQLDAAVDYRRYTTTESLQEALLDASGGIDIYFDNVGGTITDAALALIRRRARIVICGQISQYEGGLDRPASGPRLLAHLLYQRATMQGILARDFTTRMDEMRAVVEPWMRRGEIVHDETFVEGFAQLPSALGMLFDGRNIGKLIVNA